MQTILMVEDDDFFVDEIRELICECLPANLYRFESISNLEDALIAVDGIDRSSPCLLILDNFISTNHVSHVNVGSLVAERSLQVIKLSDLQGESREDARNELIALDARISHELCFNGSGRILAHIGPLPSLWRVLLLSACHHFESAIDDPRIIKMLKPVSFHELNTAIRLLFEVAT